MKDLMANYSISDNQLKRLPDRRVFFAQSAVFLLLLINAFRANTVPDIIILTMAVMMPFFLSPVEIAAYVAGFAMMGTGIQIAYVALACFVTVMLKSSNRIKSITVLSISVFLCYELMHMMMAPSDDMIEFLRYAAVYALLFSALFMDYNSEDKLRVVNSFIFGTFFSVLHIFIEAILIFNGNLLRFIDGSFRFGYAEQLGVDLTMSADPNSVGQGCSIIIAVSLMLIILGYKKKRYFAAILVALLVGTLTISKTFLLSLIVITVVTILLAGSWNSAKAWRMRILLFALIAVGVFAVLKLYPSYLDNILSRVDESDITTGRVANAGMYLDYLSQDVLAMLFGVGMQNVGEKIGFTGSPHAMFVEALICWGIVGTFAMLGLLVYAIHHHTRNGKILPINWVPLIVYLVITQTTQLFRLRDRVLTLIVIIVTVGISQKGDKKTDDQEKGVVDR